MYVALYRSFHLGQGCLPPCSGFDIVIGIYSPHNLLCIKVLELWWSCWLFLGGIASYIEYGMACMIVRLGLAKALLKEVLTVVGI